MRPSCMGSFSVGRETVGGRDDATCGVEARLSNWRPQSDETSDPLLMTLPLIIIELYGTDYHLGQVLRSRPRNQRVGHLVVQPLQNSHNRAGSFQSASANKVFKSTTCAESVCRATRQIRAVKDPLEALDKILECLRVSTREVQSPDNDQCSQLGIAGVRVPRSRWRRSILVKSLDSSKDGTQKQTHNVSQNHKAFNLKESIITKGAPPEIGKNN